MSPAPKKSLELKYRFFKEEQQLQLRKQTLANIEQEHYANQLTLDRAEAAGQDTDQLKEALASLVAQAELISATIPPDEAE